MNDHNLDDLIIGDPEPGGGKSRSFLSLIALVLIILIVGVLLAKLIFSGPEEIESTEQTELTGMVNPAGQAKKQGAKARPAEQIPDELKPITRETLPENEALKPLPSPTAHEKKSLAPKKVEKPLPLRTGKTPQTVKKAETSAKPKIRLETKPKPKPAQLFKKVPSTSKTAKTGTTKRSYYIQLGSFKRMPEQKFLDRIKNAGYTPLIIRSGDMIKVRIGTYGSYAEAKAKLPEIKSKLGIAGFVVRKK